MPSTWLSALASSTPDAIVGLQLRADGELHCVYANPAAGALFAKGPLEGQTLCSFWPAACETPLIEAARRVARGGPSETFELAFDGKLGEPWISAHVAPVAENEVALQLSDVTAHVRGERSFALLAEATAVLASSLDLDAVLASLARLVVPRFADFCAVHVCEESGVRLSAAVHRDGARSEVVRAYFRQPLSGANGFGHIEVLSRGTPVLLERHDAPPGIARANALFSALAPVSSITVPMLLHSQVLGSLCLAYSESGRRYGTADVALADELARRAAAAADNARLFQLALDERERVEAANRAKDEFLAVVSHELRTPLTAILGWVRLLRTDSLPLEKREKALLTIERNARAQSQLVADLLDVSRIIAGKLTMNPKVLHPITVIESALDALRPMANDRGVALVTSLDTRAGPMRADPDRLQQMIGNLVSNAIKFSARGGQVEVRLGLAEDQIAITVVDQGDGIDAAMLPHVFERFWQASTHASHGGLGLGLAIVRHLAEMHGGSVRATSAGRGKGSTFEVRLPGPVLPLEPAEAPVVRRGDRGQYRLDGVNVLVVEDDADTREMVCTALEHAGAGVTPAPSAADALTALRRSAFAVIVSDVGMPGDDGYAFIEKVRQMLGDVPAVALTAHARNDDRARALMAGFQMHVAKPVDPAELVFAVASLAERVRAVPQAM